MGVKEKKAFPAKVIFKISAFVFAVTGTILTLNRGGFMSNTTGFFYFTIQSNIGVAALSLAMLIYDVKNYKNGKAVPRAVLIIKYIFTVAITVTFLVFFLALAPSLPVDYLLSFNNLTVHLIVPVLAIADFFLFDYSLKLSKRQVLWGLIMPLFYLVLSVICSAAGMIFYGGQTAPYFFLDYIKFGWFGFSGGLGVFYWILIMLAAITGVCFLLVFLKDLRLKRADKKAAADLSLNALAETAAVEGGQTAIQ